MKRAVVSSPYKIYVRSLNWWIFSHGNKTNRVQNKLNLTKNKKNKKQSTTVGNGSSAPEEIFTRPTPRRLSGER